MLFESAAEIHLNIPAQNPECNYVQMTRSQNELVNNQMNTINCYLTQNRFLEPLKI